MVLAPEKKFVLCSDSLSSLQSLTVLYSTDALSMQVQLLIDCFLIKKYQLVFCWIPGHVQIRGNELADNELADQQQNMVSVTQNVLFLWYSQSTLWATLNGQFLNAGNLYGTHHHTNSGR